MTTQTQAKLPRHIQAMVEKNNFVMAIKNLASEENISMDEAKAMIDAYEEHVKEKRMAKQQAIQKKQTTSAGQITVGKVAGSKSLKPYLLKISAILIFGFVLIALITKYL